MHADEPSERKLLGAFIRSHRERLAPEELGLPPTSRRRTPGLRREELAQLSGVSATWLTWIEQGRVVSTAAPTLARLATALRLEPAERAYLFTLAGRADPNEPPPRSTEPPADLAAAVEALSVPAYGLDPCWNRCSWNRRAARLFADWVDGPEPNLVRYIFLSPGARTLIVDWEDRARRVVAELRNDYSRRLHDPDMRALVDGLLAESEEFARHWEEQAVLGREGGLRRFQHPRKGPMAYRQHTFSPAGASGYKLVMLTPTQP